MPRYEVENSRDDVPPELSTFEAKNDTEAREHFYEKFVGSTTFSWDYLVLRRVILQKKTEVLEIRDPNECKRKSASVGG